MECGCEAFTSTRLRLYVDKAKAKAKDQGKDQAKAKDQDQGKDRGKDPFAMPQTRPPRYKT